MQDPDDLIEIAPVDGEPGVSVSAQEVEQPLGIEILIDRDDFGAWNHDVLYSRLREAKHVAENSSCVGANLPSVPGFIDEQRELVRRVGGFRLACGVDTEAPHDGIARAVHDLENRSKYGREGQ